MKIQSKNILGIGITTNEKEYILEKIEKYLKNPAKKEEKPVIIFTPNPEIINCTQKDKYYSQIVRSAHINIPDGMGISWAIKKVHNKSVKRIAGIDLMSDLLFLAEKNAVRIGFIGGRDGVALQAAKCLRVKQKKLKIEIFRGPEINLNGESGIRYQVSSIKNPNILNTEYLILNTGREQHEGTKKYFISLAKELYRKKVGILFVAFGFPKQEYFVANLKSKISKLKTARPIVLMTVGGAFDYISGRVPRAPLWMRDRGLEWFYRLVREPWRLGRQIEGAKFFWKIIHQ